MLCDLFEENKLLGAFWSQTWRFLSAVHLDLHCHHRLWWLNLALVSHWKLSPTLSSLAFPARSGYKWGTVFQLPFSWCLDDSTQALCGYCQSQGGRSRPQQDDNQPGEFPSVSRLTMSLSLWFLLFTRVSSVPLGFGYFLVCRFRVNSLLSGWQLRCLKVLAPLDWFRRTHHRSPMNGWSALLRHFLFCCS